MTVAESTQLDRLRDELHAYHVDVQRLVQRCESCSAKISQIEADLYGLPGDKEMSPGVMGAVADLRQKSRFAMGALRGVWVALTIVFAAVVASILQVRQ